MAIVYKGTDDRLFYVVARYQVDQKNWIRYTSSMGEEFTCLEEAFLDRFRPVENES